MAMSQKGWPRRSSSLKLRVSYQDAAKMGNGSRIPLRSSQQASSERTRPVLQRTKSTLGFAESTPQASLPSASKITPQSHMITPMFHSSKKSSGLVKDSRNIHDKEFLRENHAMVLNYFKSQYPTVFVKQSTDIRPMTIKGFIEMINHLFSKLGICNRQDLVQFTQAGYQNDLPHWMKQLHYPGSITKGWLQTVNVPTNWPNVLAIISWLVTLVNVVNKFDVEEQLKTTVENDQEKFIYFTIFRGCLKAHNRFNAGDENAFPDVCREVISCSEGLWGLSEEGIQQLEEEIEGLQAAINDPELQAEKDEFDELQQRLEVAKGQNKKSNHDIAETNKRIEKKKETICAKERNIYFMHTQCSNLRQEISTLSDKVKRQSMSLAEFSDKQKKCDYLLKDIACLEKECEDNEKLVQQSEWEVTAIRDKILQNASSFNRCVIQLEQQIPELGGIRARIIPESPNVVGEIEEIVEAIKKLKTKLVGQVEQLEALRQEKQMCIDMLKNRLQEIGSCDQATKAYVVEKKEEIAKLKIVIAEKEAAVKAEVEELERELLECNQKQMENKSLMEKMKALEERIVLMNEDMKSMADWTRNTWKIIIERAKLVKSHIADLESLIKHHSIAITEETDKLLNEHE